MINGRLLTKLYKLDYIQSVMEVNSKSVGKVIIGFVILLLVILTLIKLDNDSKSIDLCNKYGELNLDMNTCPVHTSKFTWEITLAYSLGILILIVGLYLVFLYKPHEAKPEFKQVNLNKLDDDEKLVYSLIKTKSGSVYQTELIKETQFSKVKITRVLDRLEAKGIIERRRRGMTNLVVLK